MVAIHAEPRETDLFRFFWREIELIGARVYEPQDFDEAIRLLSAGIIDTERFITDRSRLSDIGPAFAALADSPDSMKTLIDVREA